MNSSKATLTTDLPNQLSRIGLHVTASGLDDFIARAVKLGWSPRMLLEEIVRSESQDRDRRGLDRRLRNARLGRFKPIADFDWNWPKKIDRDLHLVSPPCWTASLITPTSRSSRARVSELDRAKKNPPAAGQKPSRGL